MLLLLAGIAAASYFGYGLLRQHLLEREASLVIEEAGDLLGVLQQESGLTSFQSEYDTARRSLGEAIGYFEEENYATALRSSELSRNLLSSILDSLRHQGSTGEARFIAVRGDVQYRKGDEGAWRTARARVSLQPGDWIKTAGNGSAELMFLDGTLFTVRPKTVILVERSRQEEGRLRKQGISVEYGWVNLSTADRESLVSTPEAEARVSQRSEAMVAFDQEDQSARFAAYRGGMEVTSSDGETRSVRAMEQVVQADGALDEAQPLPEAPLLLEPSDSLEIDMSSTAQVVLSWDPVTGAEQYALQVSTSRLFADNIIDVANRTKTIATLGLQGEGSFVWRVAAVGDGGIKSPWSTARRFRVVDTSAPPAQTGSVPTAVPEPRAAQGSG